MSSTTATQKGNEPSSSNSNADSLSESYSSYKEEYCGLEEIRPNRTVYRRTVLLGKTKDGNDNDNHDDDDDDEDENNNVLEFLFVHGSCASSKQYDGLLQAMAQKIIINNNNTNVEPQKQTQQTSSSGRHDHKNQKNDSDKDCYNFSFSRQVRVYLYDMFGCGQSASHNKYNYHAYSSQEHLQDLQAIYENIIENHSNSNKNNNNNPSSSSSSSSEEGSSSKDTKTAAAVAAASSKRRSSSNAPFLVIVAHSYAPNLVIRLINNQNNQLSAAKISSSSSSEKEKQQQQQQHQHNKHEKTLPVVGLVFLSTALLPESSSSSSSSSSSVVRNGGHGIFKLPVFLLNLLQSSMSKNFVEAAYYTQPSSNNNDNDNDNDNDKSSILKEEALKSANQNHMAMCKAYYRQIDWATVEEAQQVKIKTLLIHGQQDQVLPLELGKHVQQSLPNACSDLKVVKEASHQVFEEKPDEVADLILDFITSLH